VKASASSQVFDRDLQGGTVWYATDGWIDRRGQDL
jgi:hypothetical protein